MTLVEEYYRQVELPKSAAYVVQLDQIYFIMTWILQQMGQTYPKHWARFYISENERPFELGDTYTAMAVEYCLCTYLVC
jgi:hypothetical protein